MKMIEISCNHLRFLPVFCFVWLILTFLVSYGVASSLGHVHPLWPYISDTGTIPPDSCIFGLMLNIGSLLMGLIIYVRYQQVKLILLNIDKNKTIIKIMNIFCIITGMIAAFGGCIVANFQETSHMGMHLVGANMCFGVGTGYFIVHTILCFVISRNSRILNIIRVFLCACLVIFFTTTLVYAEKSFSHFEGTVEDALLWDSEIPGYELRLASTISEWILGVCQGLYILSYAYEFRNVKSNTTYMFANINERDYTPTTTHIA